MATQIGQLVGRRIRQLRKARGLTQAELAGLVGKSVETISNFERGKTITSLFTLAELSRHLNVALKEFFDDAPSEPFLSPVPPKKYAASIQSALNLLSEEDIRIVASVTKSLMARKHKKPLKPPARASATRGRK